MSAPAAAFQRAQPDLGSAEGDPILEQTAGLSAQKQHFVAATLVDPTFVSEKTTNVVDSGSPKTQSPGLPSASHQFRREGKRITSVLDPETRALVTGNIEQAAATNTDTAVFEEHAKAASALALYTDESPDLNTRIDATTRLLIRADRKRALKSINKARRTFRAHRAELTPKERHQVRQHLDVAADAYRMASDVAGTRKESLDATVRMRADTIRWLGQAHTAANVATQLTADASEVTVEITSRGDPIRNGSEPITRSIAGEVTGAAVDEIESVRLDINGEQTVRADVTPTSGPTTEFNATVTLKNRQNTIEATVYTTDDVVSGGSEPDDVGGGGGGSSSATVATRLLPSDITTTGTGNGLFRIDTPTATVPVGPAGRAVTSSVTIESQASGVTLGDVRVLETRPPISSTTNIGSASGATEPVSATPSGTVAVLDVVVTAGDSIDQSRATIEYTTTRDDLERVSGSVPANLSNSLQLYRYSPSVGSWERVSASASVENDTVRVTSQEAFNVTRSLVAVAVTDPDGKTTVTPSTSDSTPETDISDDVSTDDVTPQAEPTADTGIGLDGFVDSVISTLERLVETIENFLSVISPGAVVNTAPGSSVSYNPSLNSVTSTAPTTAPLSTSVQDTVNIWGGIDTATSDGRAQTDTNVTAVASDELLLDGDGLPDEFERSKLGSDPRDFDSDINATPYNESDDGFVDGAHDSDGDSVLNAFEASTGLDSLDNDTDADGLGDGVEARFGRLNGTVADTNGDGISDNESDPDSDGLTNSEEVARGTAPFDADTDADGLDDSEELSEGTDPRDADTDDDGLGDNEELELPANLDPTDEDTDSDGVLDGNETFTTTMQNQSLSVGVDITGQGNVAAGVSIENGSNPNIATFSAVQNASVSPMVNIESEQSFDEATLTFDYNESRVTDPRNLSVYRRNETTGGFEPLNSTVDPQTGTISARTEHFSRFVVFRVPNWAKNFDTIEPPNVRGEASLVPVDAAFILDSSGSMGSNDPNGLRKTAAKEFVGGLIPSEDRAAVVDFDNDARTLQSLTADFDAVNSSIDRIDSFGGTDIASGIREATDDYQANSNASRAKIAVLLTDGIDFSNKQAAAQEAADENITIYTVGFGSARESDLRTIASTTGGNFTLVDRPEDLPEVFGRIAETTGPKDSDGDGLSDTEELAGFRTPSGERIRTNPFDADTDGDGTPDGVEAGTVQSVSRSVTVTVANSTSDPVQREYNQTVRVIESDPTDLDSDNDGLTDRQERGTFEVEHTTNAAETKALEEAIGVIESAGREGFLSDKIRPHTTIREVSTDPNSFHSDGDGIGDGREVTLGTDPTRVDTDDDHMDDDRELTLEQEDPTLFDSRKPTIKVHSISTSKVRVDRGFTPIPAIDRKYTVTYTVSDNAGVEYSVLKRGDLGDRSRERSDHGNEREDRVTADVIADSVILAGTGGLLFGETVKIKPVDINGNGNTGDDTKDFVKKGQPNIWQVFVKNVGDILPNFSLIQVPLIGYGILDGFLSGFVGSIASLIDMVISLAANPFGELRNALDLVFDLAETILTDTFGFINGLVGSLRERQQASNPFQAPPVLSNPRNGVNDLGQLFEQQLSETINLELSAFTTSDYTAFGAGFIAGYILSFVIDKIVSVAITVLSGGAGAPVLLASIVAIAAGGVGPLRFIQLVNRANRVVKAATTINKVLTAVAVTNEVVNANEIADNRTKAGIAAARHVLSTIGNLKVVERLPTAFDEAQPNSSLLERLTGSVSTAQLAMFLARTGEGGSRTYGASLNGNFDEAKRLLNPEVGQQAANARFQRVLVNAQANGDVTELQVSDALETIESTSGTERTILGRTVSEAGSEGVTFLAVADSSTVTSLAGELDSERETLPGSIVSITYEPEFYTLVRQAGGADTADAVSTLGTETTIDLLKWDSGASSIARANIIDAVASDNLSASEVDRFVAEIKSASLNTRQQRLNDVAYSANNSETAAAVTANGGEPNKTSRSIQASAESSLESTPSTSFAHPQTAVAPANGNRAIAGARSTG